MVHYTVVGGPSEGYVVSFPSLVDRARLTNCSDNTQEYAASLGTTFSIGEHAERIDEHGYLLHSSLQALEAAAISSYIDERGL